MKKGRKAPFLLPLISDYRSACTVKFKVERITRHIRDQVRFLRKFIPISTVVAFGITLTLVIYMTHQAQIVTLIYDKLMIGAAVPIAIGQHGEIINLIIEAGALQMINPRYAAQIGFD